jgi:hypothetical protein
MTRGFTVLAYPAQYRNSGIMTFMAGKSGVVYQKDLGEKTGELVPSMMEVKPSDGWTSAVPRSAD